MKKKFKWSNDLKKKEKGLHKFLKEEQVRFNVLRTLSVRRYYGHRLIEDLMEQQNRKCAICHKSLGRQKQVDHIISVKKFSEKIKLPIKEAYKRCHALKNLQAVHMKCNNKKRMVE